MRIFEVDNDLFDRIVDSRITTTSSTIFNTIRIKSDNFTVTVDKVLTYEQTQHYLTIINGLLRLIEQNNINVSLTKDQLTKLRAYFSLDPY